MVKTPAYLVPNPVYKIDQSTQQTPGVKVTREEQKMANARSLEYMFQVELFIKSGTDLAVFQVFNNKILRCDKDAKFLPYYGEDTLPEIDTNKTPFKTIRGNTHLRHYLGPYKINRNRLYRRFKVRTSKTFNKIKQQIVEWLRKELHWIKADYIQAKRISNIGLLLGLYNAVNLNSTRTAL